MTIFEDGTAQASIHHREWVFFYWKTNTRGRLPVSLVKFMRRVERYVREHGLKGWIANSEKGHTDFHQLMLKVGAYPYDEDGDLIFFKKEISHV